MEGSRRLTLQKELCGRLFVTASQIAEDARAPCFEGDEKFYSCPVALAGAKAAHKAFEWRKLAERGALNVLGPIERLSATVLEAIAVADAAIADRENWEWKRARSKSKR